MKRILIATAMSLWVVSLAAISSADTLILRDGTRVQGTVVGITTRAITFRHVDGITRRYSTSQVQGLEFLSAGHQSSGATVTGRSLRVRAGTDLLLRTAETLDSRLDDADRPCPAIVEQAVMTDLTLASETGVGKNTRIAETTFFRPLKGVLAGDAITLSTRFPFSYVGSAPERFIVRAREAGGPQ